MTDLSPSNSWYMVESRAGTSYVTPQFAVLANSGDDAIRQVKETFATELNELLPADRQLVVGGATRLCEQSAPKRRMRLRDIADVPLRGRSR